MFYRFPVFEALFSQCFTTKFIGTEALTPAERRSVGKVAEKRAKDFSTGRFCARKALEDLGFPGIEILIGAGREPLWPENVVGSISHSEKLAGAIVSRAGSFRSVGLDIETIGGIKKDLWDNLFGKGEKDFLKDLRAEEQELYSTILFSLKESFYKLQYPLTGQFLEFNDVEIRCINNNFSFRSDKLSNLNLISPGSVTAHWMKFGDQVICSCYLIR